MKQFSEISINDCDKCGGGSKKMEYVDTLHAINCGVPVVIAVNPYILWTCRTCGFTEKSYPKDNKGD